MVNICKYGTYRFTYIETYRFTYYFTYFTIILKPIDLPKNDALHFTLWPEDGLHRSPCRMFKQNLELVGGDWNIYWE